MSYSSLAELERCGYRYYLERVLRLPEDRAAAHLDRGPGGSDRGGPDHGGSDRGGSDSGCSDREDGTIDARVRGTIVHGLLEAVDFARPLPPSARDVASAARRIGADLTSGEREGLVELIAAALDSEPARLLASARRARREHPFAFSLGPQEPLVTGVLDLLAEQPDGSGLIVDYKSDRLTGEEDLEALVRRDYGFQRLLYALAALEDGTPRVTVAHWFLERPDEWVTAPFELHEQTELRKRLLTRIAALRAKGFAVAEDPHRGLCLTCPGRGGLCSWGETRTMSERSTTLESDA